MSTANEIAFKLHLFNKDGIKTIHRFRGTYEFDQLLDVITRLNAGLEGRQAKHLLITYTDCDGDEVSLQSPLEWNECRLLHKESTSATSLVLTARPVAKSTSSKINRAASVKSASPVVLLPPATAVVSAVVTSERSKQADLVKPESVKEHQVTADVKVDNDTLSEALRLTQMMESGEKPPIQDVIGVANMEIEKGALTSAEVLLEAALSCFPQHRIVEYNNACVAALLGATDRAIHFLTLAVEHGYNDVDHIIQDEDLKSLHSHEKFAALVKKLGQELPKQSSVTQQHSHVASPPVQKEVAHLMELFPGLDLENAIAILRDCGGDVDRAIDKCLEF